MTAIVPTAARYRTKLGVGRVVATDFVPESALRESTFFFADIDDAEVFKPPPGTVGCAWQPSLIAAGAGLVAATIGTTGILFSAATSTNTVGWLHCLSRGSKSEGTTSEAPVSKGTAGYVEAGSSIFLNHRSATPNTGTSGRQARKLGLRLRFFPFVILGASDGWASETSRLCPGIVAVAWQADDVGADFQVAVTLGATGNVVFTSAGGGTGSGTLWAWSRR